ncbi:extracellular solute-binding protein [bacterium]|nr:MAG: extracellular solute-binding protein [bacterium]
MKQNRLKTISKIVLVLLAVVFTAQSCTGGGGTSQKNVTLVWWKPFDDYRQIQPLVDAYQKTHSGVQIQFVKKNIETYESELVNALASGTGPDIFSIHNDWLPKHKDKMAPAPDKTLSLRTFGESFVEAASTDLVADNKIYAIPLAVDTLALYYNRDMLSSAGIANPPRTWEELVAMAPKLVRQDNQGNFTRSAVAMGTADNVNRAPDILALLMLQNGTVFYNPTREVSTLDQTVNDSKGIPYSPGARALEFYTQFANPAKVTYNWNNKSNNSIEAFANSQAAMIFSYSYLRATLQTKAPFLNYAVAPVPQIDPANRINFANYWAESVSKQSPNAAVAWDFLNYISQKSVLTKYYDVVKQPSSRLDILQSQISDTDIGVFAENVLSAKSYYKPDSDGVENIFVQMINDVILRNVPADEAVRVGAQKINLLLRNSP